MALWSEATSSLTRICIVLVIARSTVVSATDQLPPEAIAAWEKVAKRFSSCHFQMSASEPSQGRYVDSIVTSKSRGDNRAVLNEVKEGDDWIGEGWVRNARYVFKLRRSGRNGQWALAGWAANTTAQASIFKDIQHTIEVMESGLRYYPLAANQVTVLDLARHPSFRVIETSFINETGLELQDFSFRVDPNGEPRPGVQFKFDRGHLVLDRARSWLPVKVRLGAPGRDDALIFEMSDFREQNGVWVPFTINRTGLRPGGTRGPIATSKVEFIEIGEPGPPEGDFTLTAFGLPEPLGMESQGIPAYLWALGAGVGMIVLGLAARWWSRTRGAT